MAHLGQLATVSASSPPERVVAEVYESPAQLQKAVSDV